MNLTAAEIRDLAVFAGFHVETGDIDLDQEFVVMDCPSAGVKDEECDTPHHYAHIAYDPEYPEEGVMPLGEELPQQTTRKTYARSGHEALWAWFSLSYASWLTLPRVLMHEMPDEWQARMAGLLKEYDKAWNNLPALGTRVQVTKGSKLVPTPEWVKNYRHPIRSEIERLRGEHAAGASA